MTTKEHPILFSGPLVRAILSGEKTQTRRLVRGRALEMIERDSHELLPCPYGYEKDRLWVRETWGYDQDGPHTSLVLFRADRDDLGIRWRPSIHMPRWASRISLEVTEVRVQRVQEITDEDADAEGTTPLCRCNEGCDICARSPVDYFQDTWDSLAPEGLKWADNPWVWAVSFELVHL